MQARADNVQACGDSPLDVLGEEEDTVCDTAFDSSFQAYSLPLWPWPVTAHPGALTLSPVSTTFWLLLEWFL